MALADCLAMRPAATWSTSSSRSRPPFGLSRSPLEPDGRRGAVSSRHARQISSISNDGTLAYAAVPEDYDQLLLLDRSGNELGHIGERQYYIAYPSFSPDASRVAVWGFGELTETDWGVEIWIHDVDQPTKTRLTSYEGVDLYPKWTSDGKRVSYSSDRNGGGRAAHWKTMDGSGEAELLLRSEVQGYYVSDWSHDGRFALVHYIEKDGPGRGQIGYFDATGAPPFQLEPLLATRFDEEAPVFSPDDRFVAYASDASGRREVYVCSFPACENPRRVSTNGGYQVRWAKDQGSIYYVEGRNKMMEARVSNAADLSWSRPEQLFESPYLWLQGSTRLFFYDVSPDGERFVVVQPARSLTTEEKPGVIHVWQSWAAAFEEKD